MRIKLALAAILCLLTGCENYNQENSTGNTSLVIKSGFVCGWGNGTDTIEISKTTIRYVYYIPRLSQQPQISKSRSVPESEWKEIMKVVNMGEFTRLTYHTCNVCVDGCDEWINIQDHELSHKITFTWGAKIDSLSQLQEKLSQLRKEFYKP